MRVGTLFRCHRVDHRLHPSQGPLIHPRHSTFRPHRPGEHLQQGIQRAHAAHLTQLDAEVVEGELRPPQFPLQVGRSLRVHRVLRPFDQGQDIAHPKDPRRDPVRMERLQTIQRLPDTRKQHWPAGHFYNGEHRPAAGVAIQFSDDETVDPHQVVKALRDVYRVLPGHRVHDQQHLMGRGRVPHRDELGHQLVVNVLPAGRVDDDHIMAMPFRLCEGRRSDRHGIGGTWTGKHGNAGLLADSGELRDGRGPAQVRRDQQRAPPALHEAHGQLACRRRFPGSVQPDQQDHRRRLIGETERPDCAAEQPHEFLMDKLDHLLARRQMCQQLLSDRRVAHPVGKRLGDLDVHVGFQEGQPDVAERRVDIGVG